MKLRYSTTSPFARKVLVCAHELGLMGRIELLPTKTSATAPDAALAKDNPVIKIPTLVLDDGSSLYDSHVICEYLDSLSGSPRLVPASGPERWRVMKLHALADGILEAGIAVLYEGRRPKDKQWDAWVEGQLHKVLAGLDALESDVARFQKPIDLGSITVACALGWLEFRGVGGNLRAGRPRLFGWYDTFLARASMQTTLPHEMP